MGEESPELPSVLGRRGEEGGHDNMMSNDVIRLHLKVPVVEHGCRPINLEISCAKIIC